MVSGILYLFIPSHFDKTRFHHLMTRVRFSLGYCQLEFKHDHGIASLVVYHNRDT